jgi:hypothetical protein
MVHPFSLEALTMCRADRATIENCWVPEKLACSIMSIQILSMGSGRLTWMEKMGLSRHFGPFLHDLLAPP